jgi:hypothetical protein
MSKLFLENQIDIDVTYHVGDQEFLVPAHAGQLIETTFPASVWVASNVKGIGGDIMGGQGVTSEVAIVCTYNKHLKAKELHLQYGTFPHYI